MQNIELKVSIPSVDEVLEELKKIGVGEDSVLHQKDTYFNSEKGRLKLREINNDRAELIYYERPDTQESKTSDYRVTKISMEEVPSLVASLTGPLGQKVIVSKRRILFLYKNTRIHVDDVDNLGSYLELETVLEDLSDEEGMIEHNHVIELLKLERYPKEKVSYSDLLIEKEKER